MVTPYVNTIALEAAAAVSRRPRDRGAPRRADALERAGDGGARQPVERGSASSAATSPATPRRPTCSRSASTISSAPRNDARAARRPGLLPAAFGARASMRARSSKGGSTEDDLAHYRQELTRRRTARAACVVSASVADAGLLAVPDRLDGHRPDQRDLPGALHALPRAPRPAPTATAARSGACSATARWTSPSRSRALTLAAREKLDNLHLRHQLQPAAPRRPGARQRPDHPRARSRCSPAPAGT